MGETARTSGKTLYLRDLAPGLRRFLIVGLNRDPVVNGTLINLFASVRSTAPGGSYLLQFLNVVATGSSAQGVTVQAVDGGITVEGTAGSGSRLQSTGVLNGAKPASWTVGAGRDRDAARRRHRSGFGRAVRWNARTPALRRA